MQDDGRAGALRQRLYREQPDRAARGASASHAWCKAWVPGYGWRGFDPTNDLLAADSHVKVGTGRSYADVPPTRGIYRGLAGESIAVQVSTVPTGALTP